MTLQIEDFMRVERSLTIADSIATLGPAGTSSEAAARHLWSRLVQVSPGGRVVLFDTYEACLEALVRREHTTVVVANAYSGISEFYMAADVYLWGAFVLDTPPYGIASRTAYLPNGQVRLATHPAPAPLVNQLFPDDTDRVEIQFASSTSSAAREVHAGRADLALTTQYAAALYRLHFVSPTRTIRMLWSAFRSVSADKEVRQPQ